MRDGVADSIIVRDARLLHNQLWGIPSWSTHCPVATPVSLGLDDLPSILSGGYAVTSKTDGLRCVVVLGSLLHAPDTTYAVRFDRAGSATVLDLRTAKPTALDPDRRADPCEGTMLDCEWLDKKRELVLLDAVAVCGYDLKPVTDMRLKS